MVMVCPWLGGVNYNGAGLNIMEYLLPAGAILSQRGGFSWSKYTDIEARYDFTDLATMHTSMAASFDGTNYLKTSTANAFSADSSGSICLWFKATETLVDQVLFSSADEASDNYHLYITLGPHGTIKVSQKDNDTTDAVESTETGFGDDAWHFLEVRSSGTAWTLRLDKSDLTLKVRSGTNSGDWFADTTNRDHVMVGALEASSVIAEGYSSQWKTDNAGTSNDDQITLPLSAAGTYNFRVDWGDDTYDTITAYDQAEVTHTYAAGAGTYDINITGTCSGWRFNDGGDKLKFLDVMRWGNLLIGSENGQFYGCANLTGSYEDNLDTSSVTSMYAMFYSCSAFNQSVANFDTSSVTTMNYMFYSCTAFNQSVSNFDTSSVTTMSYMFRGCSVFNQTVANFDTSSVMTMNSMFSGCSAFNQSVSNFDTSSVTDMAYMFYSCSAFNQSVANFDTSAVTTMAYMLYICTAFNQSVSNFDTSSVTDMAYMFSSCSAFNQSVANFDTSSVTTMNYMFRGCTAFNQSVSNFDTSSVTSMSYMFSYCSAFDQTVANFDTSAVTTMAYMLYNCTVFDQDLTNFDVTALTDAAGMLLDSAFSQTNYDLLLVGWEAQVEQPNVVFHAGAATYGSGAPATARAALVTNGWTITDGGAA